MIWKGALPALLSLFTAVSCSDCSSSLPASIRAPPSRTVIRFNDVPTWVENIAARANGNLLLTLFLPNASLYQVENPSSRSPTLSLAHHFEEVDGLLGITESTPDKFFVLGGKLVDTTTPVNGTFVLFEVSFASTSAVSVRTVAHFPDAVLPNGVTTIPEARHIAIVADSDAGLIFRVDTRTGRHETIIQGPETARTKIVGANGVTVRDGYLYWTNSDLISVYRIRIDSGGFPARGAKVELVVAVKGAPLFDDFAFDERGNIWVATNLDNELYVADLCGSSKLVLGGPNNTLLAGDTAAVFGRTRADRGVLYVSTSGAFATGGVNGQPPEPGTVVAVDTREIH